MSLRINQNPAAMNAYRNLSVTDGQMAKSLEKLSSGFRINRAADDAAGLAISEKLRGQVNGLNKASENAQNGISLIQTAEGALNESHSILQRMRELAVQSANDTNGSDERDAIQKEVNELAKELTRISDTTEFNGQKLLDGAFSGKQLQIGANTDQTLSLSINAMDATALGVGTNLTQDEVDAAVTAAADGLAGFTPVDADDLTEAEATELAGLQAAVASAGALQAGVTGIDLSDAAKATAAITTINDAIKTVSTERATLGAQQNRLEHTVNNLNVASENLAASESRIRDTDMAKEMMSFTRSQILSQAGTAMLAQANQAPQGVLSLLR